MSKKRKLRVDLRKNRYKPPREQGWTRGYHEHGFSADEDAGRGERVRAKGDLSRRRTITTESDGEVARSESAAPFMPAATVGDSVAGRVLRVHGLQCWVAGVDGKMYRCVVRRLLRSLVIEERNVVAPGDRVRLRPASNEQGMIESVEPRHGLLTRGSRGKEHVIVANVDQLVIVAALAEPELKPHLIDRYLVSAEQGRIQPIVCLNKSDLVNPEDYQPTIGLFSQLGVRVVLASAVSGQGIPELREMLAGRETVFAGQSGVGKTSLLNAVQPGLERLVREVSETTQKGKHTTTTTELIPLQTGGWVVDTPGIRQFSIWNLIPAELDGLFPEFRPFVPYCGYPGCSHAEHEEACAVRRGVHLHWIPLQRYESYLGLKAGAEED